jgi:hypothetical protein
MVAFVAPEELDLGRDARREDDTRRPTDGTTDGPEGDGPGAQGESEEGSGSSGERVTIGPDGVDVIA